MLIPVFRCSISLLAAGVVGWSLGAPAQSLQLVTLADPNMGPPAGGGGDSRMPLLSPDGRYVLFASTANNLVGLATNIPIPWSFPPSLNVFRRDRATGITTLVSVDATGNTAGNADSLPLGISTDGRFVLFQSQASNLMPEGKQAVGGMDVFVRDLQTGTTTLVSANTNGQFANGNSRDGVLTPDGRFVAFVSSATDLDPRATNGSSEVFVRDLKTGTTTLVSARALSANPMLRTDSSEAPEITPDGRFVVFYSTATNLLSGVTAANQIYVRDLVAGTTQWASSGAQDIVESALGQSNVVCFNHGISSDSTRIVYEASAPYGPVGVILRYDLGTGTTTTISTNAAVPVASGFQFISSVGITPDARQIAFVANGDSVSNRTTCVQVWDDTTATLTLLSGDLNGQVPPGSTCDWPSIDAAGRHVVFLSTAPGLVTNVTPGACHLYLRDRQSGTTSLLDLDRNGQGSVIDPYGAPVLSEDGRVAAFESSDGNLVIADNNRDADIFARALGGSALAELVSAHDPALGSATPNGPSFLPTGSVSADGRFVAFASEASNLVPNDTNNCRDIFVRDLQSGAIVLASVGLNGSCADGSSWDPVISQDGRYVAFTSVAGNLAASDTNQDRDVFVRDLLVGTTTLVSVSTNGVNSGNQASYAPVVSSDGLDVLFQTKATDLNRGTPRNFFYRDLRLSTNMPLPTTSAATATTMSRDGRRVFYWDVTTQRAMLWEPLSGAPPVAFPGIWASMLPTEVVFSPDGSRIALCSSSPALGLQMLNANDPSQTPELIESAAAQGLRWSGDGTKLVYVRTGSPAGMPVQVWFHDFSRGTNVLVSHTYDSAINPGGGQSESADISPDGEHIAYRSTSTNLVVGMTNPGFGIYLYDTASGANTQVAASFAGASSVENRPLRPFFSGDGKSLLFASWAADLLSGDFNHNSDLFSYAFLYVTLSSAPGPGGGCTVGWPCDPSRKYRVEYKNGFTDTTWHELPGTLNMEGPKAWLQDPQSQPHRIYRGIGF